MALIDSACPATVAGVEWIRSFDEDMSPIPAHDGVVPESGPGDGEVLAELELRDPDLQEHRFDQASLRARGPPANDPEVGGGLQREWLSEAPHSSQGGEVPVSRLGGLSACA